MGSLINPGRPTSQDERDFLAEPVYLRNPETGIVFKLTHIDTVKRCQQQFYLPSSEEAMLEQSAEMYALQGRTYPPVAPAPAPAPTTTADGAADEPDAALTVHERNRRQALRGR